MQQYELSIMSLLLSRGNHMSDVVIHFPCYIKSWLIFLKRRYGSAISQPFFLTHVPAENLIIEAYSFW